MTDLNMKGWQRRQVLTAVGAGGLTAIAGCLSPSSTDGVDPRERSSGRSTEEEDASRDELPLTGTTQVVELDELGGEATMRAVPSRHVLVDAAASGGPIELPEVWAWQAEDLDPSVPGPLFRVTEGTEVDLTFENSEDVRPHTVHVHGIRKDWMADGAPASTGFAVDPGEAFTYEFEANVPGTHFYHCHVQTHVHLDMGMYGILRVDPADYEAPDREYFLTLREWDTRLHRKYAGEDIDFSHRDRTPDTYTINGRSAPTTFHPEHGSPLIVSQGDTVRLHVTNAGYVSHPFHVHNHRFQVVEKDGGVIPESARHYEDVTNVAPAERVTIEFEADADPGIYLAHCHKVNHVMNGERYPGGMVTAIVYEEAMDSDVFADTMAKAGYEG